MESVLKIKSFEFALLVIDVYKKLVVGESEYVMSKQLLRCGTSVGAMIREAQNAESKMDFVHKLAIAQKETDESIYWLELLKESGYLKAEIFLSISGKAGEILKMVKSLILTVKRKMNYK